MSVVSNWIEVLNTANLSPGKRMDAVSRWLIITRAAVFTTTLTSGLIGGLLAAALVARPDWLNFALAVIGLVIAHAANNMTNDFFDLRSGVDTPGSARAQYAPHPVLGGLISERGLVRAILLAHLVDALILIVLLLRTGWPVLALAGMGLFISVFYVAPPLRLKHHGLGELAVFLVWGPLMVGGTYYVTAHAMPPAAVWLASVPFGLVVSTVLIGKHVDKLESDRAKGVRTLPVILGEGASLWLNVGLMISFYAVVLALVLLRLVGPWVLVVVLGLPRLVRVLRIYRRPRPSEPPPENPVWPLWYAPAAFFHNKRAGTLFVLGLILNLLVPPLLRTLGLG